MEIYINLAKVGIYAKLLMKHWHDLNSETGNLSFSGVTRQIILEKVKNISTVEVKGYIEQDEFKELP